jgi:hypothetical protein
VQGVGTTVVVGVRSQSERDAGGLRICARTTNSRAAPEVA